MFCFNRSDKVETVTVMKQISLTFTTLVLFCLLIKGYKKPKRKPT